ncbi:hypothetical protein THAOC_11339, partial [Thalassiosira oceanica]
MGLMRRGGLGNLVGQPQMNRTWVRGEDADKENGDDGEGAGTPSRTRRTRASSTRPRGWRCRTAGSRPRGPRPAYWSRPRTPDGTPASSPRGPRSTYGWTSEWIPSFISAFASHFSNSPHPLLRRQKFSTEKNRIEDKPWDRPPNPSNPSGGGGDVTEYFNYGMDEHDWAEYAEGQLAIRQELTDAARQKRPPDPGIVPVVPRAPRQQGERVAVARRDGGDAGGEGGDEGGAEMGAELGPLAAKKESKDADGGDAGDEVKKEEEEEEIVGVNLVGAWGAGASKDSVLHRLIVEQ